MRRALLKNFHIRQRGTKGYQLSKFTAVHNHFQEFWSIQNWTDQKWIQRELKKQWKMWGISRRKIQKPCPGFWSFEFWINQNYWKWLWTLVNLLSWNPFVPLSLMWKCFRKARRIDAGPALLSMDNLFLCKVCEHIGPIGRLNCQRSWWWWEFIKYPLLMTIVMYVWYHFINFERPQ